MRTHPYLPNSVSKIKKELMENIGIQGIEELYKDIPKKLRLERRLDLPKAKSELEIRREIKQILSKNKSGMVSFLGAGVWPHYVPATVDKIVDRSEFLTSYTPYQPEINQGLLQAIFEYQSMICELTGMEVANSSMYDWASALGETARMATRVTHRNTFLVPRAISPGRLAVLKTYVEPVGINVTEIDFDKRTGQMDLEDLKRKISAKTSAVYVENPSFFGFFETQVDEIAKIAHDAGALFAVGVDPISLGLVKAPGDYGADIVTGEAHHLGGYTNFGGPLLGVMACRADEKLIRQMPGRLIGMTSTIDGKERAFSIALQAREQHIRRERATSNICTNESLCAISTATYLALIGPEGLRELGQTIMYKSHYAMKKLSEIEGIKVPLFEAPHFKEFTVNFDLKGKSVFDINRLLLEKGIQGGYVLRDKFPELGETALYCVTEIHTKRHIDELTKVLNEILGD